MKILITLYVAIGICTKVVLPLTISPNQDSSVRKSNEKSQLKFSQEIIEDQIDWAQTINNFLRDFEETIQGKCEIIPGTPTEGAFLNLEPDWKGVQRGRDAHLAVKASSQLAYSYCQDEDIPLAKCAELMKDLTFTNTSLDSICEHINRKCTSEEIHNPYRSIDGRCNSIRNPSIGESFTAFSRLLKPEYLNHFDIPKRSVTKEPMPSARKVSNTLVERGESYHESLTAIFSQWGIFVADDMTRFVSSLMIHLNSSFRCCTDNGFNLAPRYTHPLCFPVNIDQNDEFYSKHFVECMSYTRSLPALRSDCSFGHIEQQNQATHFLDASNIYGNTIEKNVELRSRKQGKLKTSEIKTENSGKDFPAVYPDPSKYCFGNDTCFLSGDNRINFLPQISVIRTLWMREHNRIANELLRINRNWNDDDIFEEARRIVIAEIQKITYNEWMKYLLDEKYIEKVEKKKKYYGAVNPTVSNEFASAAIRVFYTMIPNFISVTEANGNETRLKLQEYFMKPGIIVSKFDSVVRGLVRQLSSKIGVHIAEDLHNYLFADPISHPDYGYDILSLDIQRGRDNGLPGYNAYRELSGLKKATNFTDFHDVIPSQYVHAMTKIYKHVDDVDLIVGGLLERPLEKSLLGPTFANIVADQMIRTRKGDRYFWRDTNQLKLFTDAQIEEIKKVTLARVICDNTDVREIQPNVFKKIGSNNQPVNCSSAVLPKLNLEMWRSENLNQ